MPEIENGESIHEETELDKVLKIKLKVIDRETGKSRYCTVLEQRNGIGLTRNTGE